MKIDLQAVILKETNDATYLVIYGKQKVELKVDTIIPCENCVIVQVEDGEVFIRPTEVLYKLDTYKSPIDLTLLIEDLKETIIEHGKVTKGNKLYRVNREVCKYNSMYVSPLFPYIELKLMDLDKSVDLEGIYSLDGHTTTINGVGFRLVYSYTVMYVECKDDMYELSGLALISKLLFTDLTIVDNELILNEEPFTFTEYSMRYKNFNIMDKESKINSIQLVGEEHTLTIYDNVTVIDTEHGKFMIPKGLKELELEKMLKV